MRTMIGFLLALALVTSLPAQVANLDSSAGYAFQFVDNDSDGINDIYMQDAADDSSLYANNPSYNLQYKYEFGVGYGYGFSDSDQNGTNDLVDNSPAVGDTNPTIRATRLGGLEMIKRGTIRHGKDTEPTGMAQPIKVHVLHDGHCKDERYNQYQNLGGL